MLKWSRFVVVPVVMLVAGFVVSGAGPAGASCAAPLSVGDAVAQADVVVVGTVSGTRSRHRIATVRVNELWRGGVARTFEVAGGPGGDNEATSVDRTYEVGTKYLLFVQEPRAHGYLGTFGARYEDNSCSTTRVWSDDLARFRPAGATRYGTAGNAAASNHASSGGRTGWWTLVVLLGGAVIGAAAFIRLRSRRRSSSSTG